ncbi:DUF5665 domain-containing protein [Brevibacillus dissolubilis]|uniref:DUF5665 domain-containing protein n=1 Tax=Brevibacillus dissolubilis TaxID=1844116 RepID=UPI00111602CE|nr:DUF5665 domain-containing protein [Brevibacillus dissolubilis]
MSKPPDQLEEFSAKIEHLLVELDEVRKLNHTLNKVAVFLEDIRFADIVQNYTAPRKLLLTNFLAGLARGLGLTIGTAIVLALLGSLLTQFLSIPIIGDYVRQIIEYVQSYNH